MAAPPADLITALRAGTVARHLFFKMPHTSGDVLAWDGIGEFVLGGDTYLGIHDAAEISGVSQSSDLQSNAVTVTLNGVPRSALQSAGSVRGAAATITAAWITEAGAVLASKIVFAGLADNMRSKINGDTVSISLRIRAKLADWAKAPASFYTPRDQSRLYAGDTGFDFVKDIQSGTTAGWSLTEEVTTARAILLIAGIVKNDLTGAVIGSNLYGPNAKGSPLVAALTGATTAYLEETSGAAVTLSGSYVKVGGSDCYLDTSNDVRTAGGKLIIANSTTNERLRQQGAITTIGASTGNYVAVVSVGALGNLASKNGTAYSGRDSTNIVYDNNGSGFAEEIAGTFYIGSTPLVEETTGTAVLKSGGGRMQVGGADCVVSASSAIRSPGGRFIIPSGGSSAAGDFLRIWT